MGQNIPKPKQDIDKIELVCFVDSEYENNRTKRRYTTGFYFAFYVGAVVYRSKTQSINSLKYMESDIIAFLTASKTARSLVSVIW